ncbi:S-methyl-5-thioribose-1-phosphate isomerase [Alicyclobacillus mali]|uniref:Methylthioribose-1-phosphate isomerase n=1 Tax=Alicyclobacillus mali (ex Roth et al. 2021) TaxID=1123961 RepID=A0ABS0F2B2_9BACL|nr:S-methyl-5-thioribose-1-phosphate isomerase [Alicyclobacillus mali (ex Roth et al. 2021)]MBF8377442.1 S-methyl-5-thioribose-1-phosphate isomerase [Alicyclobacillus mali (ex Roth et al. 2021)]MCL6487410.1 S-methyl-5-thioribose-1-phosphate isomerase [Alicyclobacillus mali (ex Roth et al. 2021)]
MRAIRYQPDRLELLDQTRLPHETVWLTCRTAEDVYHAIRSMQVRGAPAIGAAAAFGLALEARRLEPTDARSRLPEVAAWMKTARPTAVNLMQAVDEVMAALEEAPPGWEADALYQRAVAIAERDIETNRRIGEIGAQWIAKHGGRVLTHCNTGSLATVEYGTALGILRAMHEAGTLEHVYVDETRPYLQGARLTAYELQEEGMPFDIITDSTAGFAMKLGWIDAVIVGADRIARNGDTANKIGTYSLAVLASHHGIPFYVAAPTTTIDLSTPSGDDIPIEERSATEVTHWMGRPIAPEGASARHLAFDVTPHHLITAIVTERGVAVPPFEVSLIRLCGTR